MTIKFLRYDHRGEYLSLEFSDHLKLRHPTDRVSLHTSFKSRQVIGRASIHCHVPYSSGPRLPAEVGSSAAMCPMALDLASQLRWAPALPRVIWLRTSPLG
jgi:hypothetical protein